MTLKEAKCSEINIVANFPHTAIDMDGVPSSLEGYFLREAMVNNRREYIAFAIDRGKILDGLDDVANELNGKAALPCPPYCNHKGGENKFPGLTKSGGYNGFPGFELLPCRYNEENQSIVEYAEISKLINQDVREGYFRLIVQRKSNGRYYEGIIGTDAEGRIQDSESHYIAINESKSY